MWRINHQWLGKRLGPLKLMQKVLIEINELCPVSRETKIKSVKDRLNLTLIKFMYLR